MNMLNAYLKIQTITMFISALNQFNRKTHQLKYYLLIQIGQIKCRVDSVWPSKA